MKQSGIFVALLRGINVGGHNKTPMAELRALCEKSGLSNVQSYIQSGNLVFSATDTPRRLESMLEKKIESRFGFSVPVIVRSASDWSKIVKNNPLPDASTKDPSRVLMGLAKSPLNPNALAGLIERASNAELVRQAGNVLWVHFSAGVARSKITTALLDRLAGSPVTVRNWRTVLKLEAMTQ